MEENKHLKQLNSINDENLDKVAGGAHCTYSSHNTLTLNQKEYDYLVSQNIIKDGKLKHADCAKAIELLKNKGFSTSESHLNFMWYGYKPPEYATIVLEKDEEKK